MYKRQVLKSADPWLRFVFITGVTKFAQMGIFSTLNQLIDILSLIHISAEDADVLPMWVADMDFRTAPPVVEALKKRVQHGIFGYVPVPDAYYEAVLNWFAQRHAWRMEKEWIIYTTGAVSYTHLDVYKRQFLMY